MPRTIAVVLCVAAFGAIVLFLWQVEPQATVVPTIAPTATVAASDFQTTIAYVEAADAIMGEFWQSVDRMRNNPNDSAVYRAESSRWADMYFRFDGLEPPAEYAEYHRLTAQALSIVAWAAQDIRDGNMATASDKIDNATALFTEANGLLLDS